MSPERRQLPVGVAAPVVAACVVAIALVVATDLPALIAFAPALIAGVITCFRWPAAAVVGVIFLTGTAGSLTAFTPIPTNAAINLALGALWVAVAWELLTGGTRPRLIVWPGLLLPATFIAVTGLWVLLDVERFGVSLLSFRISPWFMMAFLLVAIAPWSRASHLRIARGALLVFLVVGAYAAIRKLIGPAPAEELVARQNAVGLAWSQPAPFTGSFLHAQHLGSWMAFSIPVALALVFAWRGPWRLVAILAVAACTFALFAADRRAATVGAVAGVLVALALLVLAARSLRGTRIGTAFMVVVAIAAVGSVSYLTTIADDPGASERFERLVTDPESDPAYQQRLNRWSLVIDDLDQNPLGHGLGRVGSAQRANPEIEELDPTSVNTLLDSSFLKIAYEQGLGALILFGIAYISLLVGLALRAIKTTDRTRAALAIGACGALGALIPILYASMMIEGPTIAAAWLLVGLGAAGFSRRPQGRASAGAAGGEPAAGERPTEPAPRGGAPPTRAPGERSRDTGVPTGVSR